MTETEENERLADQITEWGWIWVEAAKNGYADTEFGMEFRHSLGRFLALTEEERVAWAAREHGWKLRNCHFDGGGRYGSDRPDWIERQVNSGRKTQREANQEAVAEIVREWLAEERGAGRIKVGVGEGAPESESVSANDLLMDLDGWLAILGRDRRPPETVTMTRAVIVERMVEAGARLDRSTRRLVGVRIS